MKPLNLDISIHGADNGYQVHYDAYHNLYLRHNSPDLNDLLAWLTKQITEEAAKAAKKKRKGPA